MNLQWITRQLQMLKRRRSPRLAPVIVVIVLGAMVTMLAAPGRRPLVAVCFAVFSALAALAMFEFHDTELSATTHAQSRGYTTRIEALEQRLINVDAAYRRERADETVRRQADHEAKMQAADDENRALWARQRASYEQWLETAEHERDEARNAAAQTKEWANEVVETLRAERDQAYLDRQAAVGRAEAALEEAAHIKRHADLLVVKAEEIARGSAHPPTVSTLPPPLPPFD